MLDLLDIESLLTNSKPIYDDYAISPFQLERIVKDGGYKTHRNFYDETIFGPPIRRNKGDRDEEITKLV